MAALAFMVLGSRVMIMLYYSIRRNSAGIVFQAGDRR